MAALRQMPPQVPLLVALASLCWGAPAPSPSPAPSASPSFGHHHQWLPPAAAWGGAVVGGFPLVVPLYPGLDGALAAHAHHAFLAAPGALVPGAALPPGLGYGGYPINTYAAPLNTYAAPVPEIYTPQVQHVHTYQAVPVTRTVQVLPVEYGLPKPSEVTTEKPKPAVVEETAKEMESDTTGDTSQTGGQAVGLDLGSTSAAGSEGESGGFSGGQVGGAEVSDAGTEAPATEAPVVETAYEVPVVQTTQPSIAYGVPAGPTISKNTANKENLQNKHFDNLQVEQSSRPKIQSLDDLVSETFSSTVQADSQSGSRTGSIDFVDVSGDARSLGASGGLDCTGKGCGTPDAQGSNRNGIPSRTGGFRLSLGGGQNEALANEVEDGSFGQETVNSPAVPNRAAKQHYYYDLPHLAGVGAASGQGGARGGSNSGTSSGGFNSGQGNANGALSGSGPSSASASSSASGGYDYPSSEPLPNYPNSVPVPPRPYSAPVPPYPGTTPPPPPYPNTYPSPVYSAPAPAYSPPGGNTNRFTPSQPDFGSGSQSGDVGGNGLFAPVHSGDLDGVYPPGNPPAQAYGLPQPPPPPAPVDSYGHPVRDLYDIRTLRSIASVPSNKQRSSSNKRRFI